MHVQPEFPDHKINFIAAFRQHGHYIFPGGEWLDEGKAVKTLGDGPRLHGNGFTHRAWLARADVGSGIETLKNAGIAMHASLEQLHARLPLFRSMQIELRLRIMEAKSS